MNAKELQELNAWIAVNLFGWDMSRVGWCKSAMKDSAHDPIRFGYPPDSIRWQNCALPNLVRKYTTDPAAAMEVLKKCAEKCCFTVEFIYYDGPNWRIYVEDIDGAAYGETLELAICLFSKKLFEKGEK